MFKIGDVVRIKGRKEKMTVVGFRDSFVKCYYFHKSSLKKIEVEAMNLVLV